jgi:hypothetical protein
VVAPAEEHSDEGRLQGNDHPPARSAPDHDGRHQSDLVRVAESDLEQFIESRRHHWAWHRAD